MRVLWKGARWNRDGYLAVRDAYYNRRKRDSSIILPRHSGERPIYGQWLLEELRRHGFRVSPGALYPLLARMARQGWLKAARRAVAQASPKARHDYVLTSKDARALAGLRRQVDELHREVVREA